MGHEYILKAKNSKISYFIIKNMRIALLHLQPSFDEIQRRSGGASNSCTKNATAQVGDDTFVEKLIFQPIFLAVLINKEIYAIVGCPSQLMYPVCSI